MKNDFNNRDSLTKFTTKYFIAAADGDDFVVATLSIIIIVIITIIIIITNILKFKCVFLQWTAMKNTLGLSFRSTNIF
jgi:hypothetical protein